MYDLHRVPLVVLAKEGLHELLGVVRGVQHGIGKHAACVGDWKARATGERGRFYRQRKKILALEISKKKVTPSCIIRRINSALCIKRKSFDGNSSRLKKSDAVKNLRLLVAFKCVLKL